MAGEMSELGSVGLRHRCVCAQVHPRAGSLCNGCRALEMGRNCWEMVISPCCDLSRDSCDTCSLLATALRTLSLTCRVRMICEGGMVIEGEVHHRPDQRMSDALNDPHRSYLAVSQAHVQYPPGAGLQEEDHEWVLVHKAATRVIVPVTSGSPE